MMSLIIQQDVHEVKTEVTGLEMFAKLKNSRSHRQTPETILQWDSWLILHLHANVHLMWTLIPDTGQARPGLGGYAGRVLKGKVIEALMGFLQLPWL